MQGPLVAQNSGAPKAGKAKAKAGPFKRLPNGKPDMQGYWQTSVFFTAFDLEEHKEATFEVPAGPGVVVDPPNGKIPYQPWALEKKKDMVANHLADDPQAAAVWARLDQRRLLLLAALLLGIAGYALQGRPGLAGSPRYAIPEPTFDNPAAIVQARLALSGHDGLPSDRMLLMADGYFRIAGGTVYDPRHGIDGEIRDVWILNGKIAPPPSDPAMRMPQPGRAAW